MRLARIVAGGIGVLALTGSLAAPAVASTASTTSGTERFTVVETTASSNNYPTSATGPIHALGKDRQLPNGMDRFTFPAGTLLIRHQMKSHTQSSDPKTCTFRFTEAGTYRVVSGTGAYSHVSGDGTYHLNGIIIGCDQHKPPIAQSIILNAAGPLKY